MKMVVMAVHDIKTGVFAAPFSCIALGQGKRLFGDWINDANTPLYKHPGDYKLYHIGYYFDDSGRLEPLDIVRLEGNGDDYVVGKRKGNFEVVESAS